MLNIFNEVLLCLQTLKYRIFSFKKKEIQRKITYSTRSANANNCYTGTLGMMQQFDQLM